MVSDGPAWLISSVSTGSRFHFKLENRQTDCPAHELISTQNSWEVWNRQQYRLRKSVRSVEYYYELSQWQKLVDPIGIVDKYSPFVNLRVNLRISLVHNSRALALLFAVARQKCETND